MNCSHKSSTPCDLIVNEKTASIVFAPGFEPELSWDYAHHLHMCPDRSDPGESAKAKIYPLMRIYLLVHRKPDYYEHISYAPYVKFIIMASSSFTIKINSSTAVAERMGVVLIICLTATAWKIFLQAAKQ